MKYRSLLLTLAFFLSTGVAFAGLIEDTPAVGDFYWLQPEGETTLTVTLTKMGAEKWHYGLYDLDDASWNKELSNATNIIDVNPGQRIGIWGKQANGKNPQKVFSVGTLTSGNFSMTHTGATVSFFNGGDIKATAALGGSGGGPVGTPLPTPIVTLLIALGFGALLVYRHKQAKI